MSKKCRFRKFLKNSKKKILNSLETWKIEAVLENQYRKWGFHPNPVKVDFEKSGKVEKNDEIEDQKILQPDRLDRLAGPARPGPARPGPARAKSFY